MRRTQNVIGGRLRDAASGETMDLVDPSTGEVFRGVAFGDHIAASLQSEGTTMFVHEVTWDGHPISSAVAPANLEVFATVDALGNVQRNQDWFGQQLQELYERHEIVGDVRGTGYVWALELVEDRDHAAMFDDDESEDLLRGFLSARTLELDLILRADDRDEPAIQLSPSLVADREVRGEVVDIVDRVLGEAEKRMVTR